MTLQFLGDLTWNDPIAWGRVLLLKSVDNNSKQLEILLWYILTNGLLETLIVLQATISLQLYIAVAQIITLDTLSKMCGKNTLPSLLPQLIHS